MIRLKKFQIKNYRSCLDSELELKHNLMCLIGVNGAGKTNILTAIQFLKKLKGNRLLFHRNKSNGHGSDTSINSVFSIEEKLVKFRCDLKYDTDERNNDEVLNAELKFNLFPITGNKKWLKLSAEVFLHIDEIYTHSSMFRNHYAIEVLSEKEVNTLATIRTFVNKISYYSASQFSDPTKCPISFELEDSKSVRPTRYGAYHEKFLNDLYITYNKNKSLFDKFLYIVNAEGIGIVDNVNFAEYDMPSSSYEVRSGGKIKRIEKNRKLIIPSFTIDSIELSPNQLSEGTFKTLALIFYIITDENELLLIEEPEVCVHHGLLNSIISLILSQSNKKQIIISTHSDFVLDRLKPDNLLIVKKIPETGTDVKVLSKFLSKDDYKALKNYLTETGNLGEYWKEGGLENE